jgi:hypothetical protein
VIDVSEFEALPQEDVRGDLRQVLLGALRMTLETLLQEEVRRMVGLTAIAIAPSNPSGDSSTL